MSSKRPSGANPFSQIAGTSLLSSNLLRRDEGDAGNRKSGSDMKSKNRRKFPK